MKHPTLQLSAAIGLFVLISSLGRTQTASRPESSGGLPAPIAPYQQDFADSRVLCAVGDFDNGEQVLLGGNHRPAGTAAWRLESASKLARMAVSMAGQGRPKAAAELTRRALLHLDQIGSEAEPGVRANALELAGFIHERLEGNAARARASYLEAVQLCPGSTVAAEALDRLTRSAAVQAQKQARGTNGG